MKLPLDENLNPVPVASFGPSRDLTDDKMEPQSAVVRLKAISESRIWCYRQNGGPEGPGAIFSQGETEYIKVPSGYGLQVQGTINITEVY